MPLPRSKATLYDHGVRMPLVIRWGDQVKGKRVVTDPVSLTDMAPTFLDLAGIEIPDQMTGRSIKNLLFSDKSGDIDKEREIITGSERLKEWEKHQKMMERSPFKSLPWIQIGPMLNSGRISSIVGIPGNPSIIYAGATVGGLWKTVNAGTTWKPVFDSAPTQVLGDIEVCPTNSDLVWVGTGNCRDRR